MSLLAVVPPLVQDIGVVAAAIAAVCAACVGIIRAITAFTKRVVDEIDGRVEKHTKPILHELSFNGGGSVKDLTWANHQAIEVLGRQLATAATDRAVIKADLSAAHERADAVPSSAESGAAADAASKTDDHN